MRYHQLTSWITTTAAALFLVTGAAFAQDITDEQKAALDRAASDPRNESISVPAEFQSGERAEPSNIQQQQIQQIKQMQKKTFEVFCSAVPWACKVPQ